MNSTNTPHAVFVELFKVRTFNWLTFKIKDQLN